MSEISEKPKKSPKGIFQLLAEVTDLDSFTKEERDEYELAMKRHNETNDLLAKMKAEAREEGILIGKRKGEEKIARTLKASGVPTPTIQAATGLTIEEIEQL